MSEKKKSAQPARKLTDEESVTAYMAALEHPLKAEMEAVRTIIKNASNNISERIKWNAPSYYCNKTDMVTFNHRAQQHVHLVFHHPAIVTIESDILHGDYKDRRMTYFKDMNEVLANKSKLEKIMQKLVEHIEQ